ncbi:TonB-dependent receptor [Telluria mixta]|uniref:TonB-dependent receptor n=1 Tax=Telluria mixta TaxID=34071 RepID=A0ABT2BWM4_9BURK|nr:TonB-dependent receptor [Telluria mixta]MCS0629533.1 TonB-dependent receptor [Telluria mixta]WEM96892.1 TonB-dependent receptor [Telluria mixta]
MATNNKTHNVHHPLNPMAIAVACAILGAPIAASAQAAHDGPAVQQVEVTGIRASKQKSLEKKRNNDTMSEVVTAEDVGKMPDKNVADALQKLPGVNTLAGSGGQGGYDENDRVSMRGTSPSLSLTTINGHSVATADWDASDQLAGGAGSSGSGAARSVSFLLLPSEIVSQVVVHKSAEADQLEGGVAGAVDIITRRPLDSKKPFTAEASVQGVYSDLAGKTNPQLAAFLNWTNANRTAGVMLQVFDQKRNVRRDSQQITWGRIGAATSAGKANNGALAGTPFVSEVIESLFQQERKRTGGSLGVEFKVTDDFTINADIFRSKLAASYSNNRFVVRPTNSISGGIIPTNVTVANGAVTSAQFDNTGAATGTQLESQVNPSAASRTGYENVDFKWRVNDALRVTGRGGSTKAEGDTYLYWNYAFLPNTATGYVYNGPNDPVTVLLPNGVSAANLTSNPGNSGADQSYSLQHSEDREHYGQLDAEYSFESGFVNSIKVGVRASDHKRSGTRPLKAGLPENATQNGQVPAASLPVIGWGGAMFPSDFGSNLGATGATGPYISPDAVVAWSQANLNANEAFNKPVSGVFTVKEKVKAAYVMARFGGERWRGNAGVRLVRTETSVTTNTGLPCGVPSATNGITYGSPAQATACAGFVPPGGTLTTGSRFGNFYTLTTDSSYTKALPSLNLVYDATKDLVLRTAAARVMSRPDYSALGASISSFAYNPAVNPVSTASGGNAKLGPVLANNYNLGIEWYFQPRSLLSAQLFFIDFDALVGSGTSTQQLLNTAVPASLGGPQVVSTVVSSPTMTTGRSKGIEFGYEQPVWGGFGIQANYTYVDAKEASGLPMLGASRNSYTAGGFYENDKFSARLVYSWRGAARTGLYGLSQNYAASSGTVAASLNYTLTESITLTFEGLNLNNPTLRYYNAADANIPFAATTALHSSGRQYYVGARFKY